MNRSTIESLKRLLTVRTVAGYHVTCGSMEVNPEDIAHNAAIDLVLALWDDVNQNMQEPNSGHGHVRKRPDGLIARCGGPDICKTCAQDQAAFERNL